MNKLLGSLIVLGAAASCVGATADRPRPGDEESLAAALANYEQSGPPTDCVNTRDLGGNRSAGEGAIIFEGTTRSRLWVNRPPGGCPNLNRGLALVIRTPTTRFCRGDIAQVIDPVARIPMGSCVLGDFTPYRLVRRR